MTNYCSECGFKLEEHHKFCPNCGNKIIHTNTVANHTADQDSVVSNQGRVIVCENCGDENSTVNSICSGCGMKLSGEEKISKMNVAQKDSRERNSEKISDAKRNKASHKSGEKRKDENLKSKTRVLESKKIILIGFVFGILVLVILFTSGILDSGPDTKNINQNVTSGVDLNRLNEITELEKKVNSNPDDLESLLHLAHLQNDSRLYEKAIQNYKKYLAINPEDANARVDMGICYYNLSDYAGAISEMETAIKYQPEHQIAHLNLGIVNLASNNLDKSKEWFQKAVNLNPESEAGKRAKELLTSH